MLGERSEEKNLLYKQLFFGYARQAQRREKFALQEIWPSLCWATKAQKKLEIQNANWHIQMQRREKHGVHNMKFLFRHAECAQRNDKNAL